MSPNFECSACHTLKEEPEGLCIPVPIRNECLSPTDLRTNLERACDQVLQTAAFYCEGCGRPTAEPQVVCMPMLIQTSAPGAKPL